MEKFRDFYYKYGYLIIGIIIGAVGGYFFWIFFGKDNRMYLIGSFVNCVFCGAALGVLLISVIEKIRKK